MQQQQEQQQQQHLQQQLQLQQQQQQNLFLQAQQLSAQPTGFGSVIPVISGYQLTNSGRSNNPFAPPQSSGTPSSFNPSPQPIQKQQPQFNLQGTYDTHSTSNLSSLATSVTPVSQLRQSPRPAADVQGRKEATQHEQRLADLFANRDDGQDTFGNIGALRFVVFIL
jgi:epsin